MSAQIRTETIVSDFKKKLNASQVVVEAKLKADNSAAITKILSINADARVLSFEAMNGEAVYNGRAAFKVLYVTDTGACGCLDYNADFSDRLSDPDITPTAVLQLNASVIDTNAVSMGADSIKVSCVVEVRAHVIAREQMEYAAGEIPDVYTRTESVNYNTLSSEGKNEFIVSFEAALNEEVETICMSEARAMIIAATPMQDSIALDGKVYVNVVYMPKGGMLSNRVFDTEFSQEIPAVGVTPDCIIDYCISVDKWQVKAETFEGENKTIVRSEFKLIAETEVYKNASADVTIDAFSVKNELQINAEGRTLNKLLNVNRKDAKIEGMADLSEGMPNADRILAVCGTQINVANCYTDSDRIIVEGVLNTNVVYFNKEFENSNSVAVEIPYSLSMTFDGMAADNLIEVRPCVTDISAKSLQSSVQVNAQISLQISRSAVFNAYCVKEINKGEERILDLNAIAIYIAKPNQTLWDVSKALSTTPEIIMEQNPNLSAPLKGGEKIIVYRQL